MIGGVVLDASAIIDAASGRTAYASAIIDSALHNGRVLALPTSAVAQAWARAAPEQEALLAILPSLPVVVVHHFDLDTAIDAGAAAGAAGHPDASTALMHVVQLARARGWPVLTADPAAIHALDPAVAVEPLP